MSDPDDPLNLKDPAVRARFEAHIEEMNKAHSVFFMNFAWFDWLDRSLEKALVAARGALMARGEPARASGSGPKSLGPKVNRLNDALARLGLHEDNASLLARLRTLVDVRNVMAHETVPLVTHAQAADFNQPGLVTSSHLVAILSETFDLINEIDLLAERLAELAAQGADGRDVEAEEP